MSAMTDNEQLTLYDFDRAMPELIDNYQPTPAERKLLVVMLDPESRVLTAKEICRRAGVSPPVYYNAMNKPLFVEYVRRLSFELIKQETMPLIQTAVAAAKLGSFPHWRALMEMGGMYQEGSKPGGEDQTITIRFADPRKEVSPGSD